MSSKLSLLQCKHRNPVCTQLCWHAVTAEEAMAALLLVPNVICLSEQDISIGLVVEVQTRDTHDCPAESRTAGKGHNYGELDAIGTVSPRAASSALKCAAVKVDHIQEFNGVDWGSGCGDVESVHV
eukprot:883514-Pelagomonas_calceolata.AAC.2